MAASADSDSIQERGGECRRVHEFALLVLFALNSSKSHARVCKWSPMGWMEGGTWRGGTRKALRIESDTRKIVIIAIAGRSLTNALFELALFFTISAKGNRRLITRIVGDCGAGVAPDGLPCVASARSDSYKKLG